MDSFFISYSATQTSWELLFDTCYIDTPDDFKAGTRAKRQKTDCHSIAEEIISEQ